jgi:hypothetical protein
MGHGNVAHEASDAKFRVQTMGICLSHAKSSTLMMPRGPAIRFVSLEGFTPFNCRRFCSCQSLKEPQSPMDFNERFATVSISISYEQQNSTAFNKV